MSEFRETSVNMNSSFMHTVDLKMSKQTTEYLKSISESLEKLVGISENILTGIHDLDTTEPI